MILNNLKFINSQLVMFYDVLFFNLKLNGLSTLRQVFKWMGMV